MEHPYGGGLGRGCTRSEKEAVCRRREVRRARARHGRDARQAAVFGVLDVEDVDVALPAADIGATTFGVDEYVVGIAAEIDVRDALAVRDREGAEPWRSPKSNEDVPPGFVERHREIATGAPQGPNRSLLPSEAIDDHDRRRLWDIYE